MPDRLEEQFLQLGGRILDYLPYLIAGVVLVVIGLFLGWLVKRVVVQLSVILRLERFLTGFRRHEAFTKADVRYGFYNFMGNIALVVVFLVFLDAAVSVMKLTVLSSLLEKGIYYIPKIILALVIFGVGWFVSGAAARTLERALNEEQVPRSSLIARVAKAVILIVFSSMALIELDIARQIVVFGFATTIVTVGVIAVLFVLLNGKDLIRQLNESFKGE